MARPSFGESGDRGEIHKKRPGPPILAQHPEPFNLGASHYKPDQIRRFLSADNSGWIPPEWEWSLSFGPDQRGECCGIAGGNQVDFIQYYAKTALQVIDDPRNRTGWASVADKGPYNISIEQYHLAACVDYHRDRPDSPFRGVEIRYVFDSFARTYDANLGVTVFSRGRQCPKSGPPQR